MGCYDGLKLCPRNITERNIALILFKNLFCLIWISNGNSFNKAIEELKLNFEIVHIVTSDKLGKSFIKYEHKPEKFQSQLTNMIVYDLEILTTDRAILYAICK